ncbi:ROK family protein [Alkalibacterium pelagium]|jgi:predicted NBD/HSP70 family sugar kinase|uniref:Sugar kinase of the NBD/HSP70 family, may contain an N-terminal HTH domain n=1 Tax=Alkalibacterium pelagium TaxID=426702 RepID=A0A1H7PRU3_9LACT|nr:ROK family protein [Alkalibacterium pelagium]GEN51697.1 sugar kinase [Alkalibacterium pelagium]SEL38493.1 Sugar kinase of the NBD/HSP70 family, may contain an N-terminal HTH domain [Alkalibacterium pelagium]
MDKFIVYDIGGSFIKFALMDEESIHVKGKVKTPKTSFDELLHTLEHVYQPFAGTAKAAAISMPGLIDSKSGYAIHGGSLSYIRKMNVADMIKERLKIPVVIENDGKSAALGEAWKGGLKGVENGVSVVLGTGIGGGIVLNGELVRGEHLGAGEFSFIRLNKEQPTNPEYILGNKGSIVNLIRQVAIELEKDPKEYTGEDMFEAIRQGNNRAKELLKSFCKDLSVQLLNLQAILDPEVFVIGGGISAEPMLIEIFEEVLDEIYSEDFFYKVNGYKVELRKSPLGNDANLFGVLHQYLTSEKSNQEE